VIVSDLAPAEIARTLRRGQLMIEIGPFVYRMRSSLPALAERLGSQYADFPLRRAEEFADFHVRVDPPNLLRRWVHANVAFELDGVVPFKPLPRAHAFALLESGLNWCVAQHAHTFLVIHAAVVEKFGCAMLMPAPPGSGKSTLCAGLVHRGWRLLSDELALIRPADGLIAPCPRPVSLKNESIDVMRQFAPDATILHTADDTIKGTVAHMKPPARSVQRAAHKVPPAWILFPRYAAGEPSTLRPFGKGRALMSLATNSFNYNIAGASGFHTLCAVVERCECLEFVYGDLEDAVRVFDRLASGTLEPDDISAAS
jgi:hypothetical protein